MRHSALSVRGFNARSAQIERTWRADSDAHFRHHTPFAQTSPQSANYSPINKYKSYSKHLGTQYILDGRNIQRRGGTGPLTNLTCMQDSRSWMFCPFTGTLLNIDPRTGIASCPDSQYSVDLTSECCLLSLDPTSPFTLAAKYSLSVRCYTVSL